MKKPLVSFCIATYNQEKYVKQAIVSIFEQTYSPMEIIICDDCSKDKTVDIIEQLIEEYKNKKYNVCFIKNKTNIGVAKNLDHCYRLAKGSLIVCGAGDDYYKPERVEKFVNAWEQDNEESLVIHSAYIEIDNDGNELCQKPPRSAALCLGAVCAYSRKIFDFFPPFDCELDAEDQVLGKRGLILGRELQINEPLTFYRVGTGYSTKLGGSFKKIIQDNKSWLLTCHQVENDLLFAQDKVPQENIDSVKNIISKIRKSSEMILNLYTGKEFCLRKLGFDYRWKCKPIKSKFCRDFVKDLSMLLPCSINIKVVSIIDRYFISFDQNRYILELRKLYRKVMKHGEFSK